MDAPEADNRSNPDTYEENGTSVIGVIEGESSLPTNSNLGDPDEDSVTEVTAARSNRRLTRKEAERVKRLVREGMAPKWARAEVLGEGNGPGAHYPPALDLSGG